MKKMLKMIEKLLKQGRGYNMQSHGINPAGDDFYNFALYPLNNKGSTFYVNSHTLEEIVEKLSEYMVEGNIIEVKTLCTCDSYDEFLCPIHEEQTEEEYESMEDML